MNRRSPPFRIEIARDSKINYDLDYPVLADSTAQPATADAETTAAPAAMTDGANRFDAFADVEAGVETIQESSEPDETLETVRDLLN